MTKVGRTAGYKGPGRRRAHPGTNAQLAATGGRARDGAGERGWMSGLARYALLCNPASMQCVAVHHGDLLSGGMTKQPLPIAAPGRGGITACGRHCWS